jgi:hypothetical protein
MLDYTFERQILLERQEAWKEGFIVGWKESFIERLLNNGKTPQEIADFCGFNIELIQEVEARSKASC